MDSKAGVPLIDSGFYEPDVNNKSRETLKVAALQINFSCEEQGYSHFCEEPCIFL